MAKVKEYTKLSTRLRERWNARDCEEPICPKCGSRFVEYEMHYDARGSSGFRAECRECLYEEGVNR